MARTQSGEMILIEINDGGTAGLPPSVHPFELYSSVADAAGDRASDEVPFREFD